MKRGLTDRVLGFLEQEPPQPVSAALAIAEEVERQGELIHGLAEVGLNFARILQRFATPPADDVARLRACPQCGYVVDGTAADLDAHQRDHHRSAP